MLPNGEMGAVVSGGPVEGMLQVLAAMLLSMEMMMMRISTPERTGRMMMF